MSENSINYIQKFNNLKYYPKNNIDKKCIDFIKSMNVDKECPLESFVDKLNFFLNITGKYLNFKNLNNKKNIKMWEDFYSFIFSENNFFGYSDSSINRYKKIFRGIEENLGIEISKKYNFNYLSLPKERLDYFMGWSLTKDRLKVFVDLIKFYDVFGREKTTFYFEKIEKYYANKSLKTYNQILYNDFFNYLAINNKNTVDYNDIVYIMKKFFTDSESKNNDLTISKKYWNSFVHFINYLFPFENHTKYLLKVKSNYNTNIKKTNNSFIKTKLITEIPLEIYDNEAFDILFKKINQDVEIINNWADYTIDYHYKCFLKVNDDLRIKPEYINKTVTQMAMIKYGKYDKIAACQIYEKNSYFNRNIMYAICIKLILNHPEITDSFLLNCLYYDEKDNVIGVRETDQGTYLIGYKKRRGIRLAEQKILLNKETSKLISILLEMTKDIREGLKKDKNSLYKKLFISAGVNNLLVTDCCYPAFSEKKEPYSSIIKYVQDRYNITKEDSIKFTKNISLTRVRASRGVQVYFETKSTTKMAKALGHVKYDPQLLSRYLPDSILDFFQRRWILLFQKGIICEAMKDSDFLLKASNFSDMDKLNKFLENHTLKQIPDVKVNKKNDEKVDNDLKVYISVDEEKIAALLSIGKAIEESKNLDKVSSKAIYWKQLGEEIVKEINNNKSYSQYKQIIENAKNKIRIDLFDKVIYE